MDSSHDIAEITGQFVVHSAHTFTAREIVFAVINATTVAILADLGAWFSKLAFVVVGAALSTVATRLVGAYLDRRFPQTKNKGGS